MSEFSWWLDQDPRGYSDNKVDGAVTTVAYNDIASGIWYFHVKGKINDTWGQQSTYAAHIDNTPPAVFTPVIEPTDSRPGEKRVITFSTTDQHSGLDHYEVKILSLDDKSGAEPFFTEHTSPWLTTPLDIGRYKIVVRAYDTAGNWQDGTDAVTNTPPPPDIRDRLNQGIVVGGYFIAWWKAIIAIVGFLLIILIILILWRRAHEDVSEQVQESLEKAHRRLRVQHDKIAAELKEEQQVREVLSQELKDLKQTDADDNKNHYEQT